MSFDIVKNKTVVQNGVTYTKSNTLNWYLIIVLALPAMEC